MKKHIQYAHLPWYLHPTFTGWTCEKMEGMVGRVRAQHRDCLGDFDSDRLPLWVALLLKVLWHMRFWAHDLSLEADIDLRVALQRELDLFHMGEAMDQYKVTPHTSVAGLLHHHI